MAYRDVILGDSPIAYWRLGDSGASAADSTVNGYTGTLNGGVTTGAPGAPLGDPDTAMTFDGSTGYIAGTYSALDSAVSNHDFSVEFWGYWTGVQGGGTHFTHGFSLGNGGAADTAIVVALNQGNQVFFSFYADDVFGNATNISANAWHHYVVTFVAASKTWVIYIDGVQDSTGTSAGTPTIAGTGPFTIGRAAYTADNYWQGRLDEVVLYSTTLSSTQVSAHYTAGLTAFPTPKPASFQSWQGPRLEGRAPRLGSLPLTRPVITKAWEEFASRFTVAQRAWTDARTRLRVNPPATYTDLKTRFRLRSAALADLRSRFIVLVSGDYGAGLYGAGLYGGISQGFADLRTRWQTAVRSWTDARSRFQLAGISLKQKAGPHLVGSGSGTGGTTNVLAYGSSTTAGDLLVLGSSNWRTGGAGAAISGITDTQGNTWAFAGGGAVDAQKTGCEIWYAANSGAGANTVTVTYAAACDSAISIAEYAGAANVTPLDVSAYSAFTTPGTPTTVSSGAVAPAAAAELAVGLYSDDGQSVTVTVSGGTVPTAETNDTPSGVIDQVFSDNLSTTGAAQSASFSTTATLGGVALALFKLAGGATRGYADLQTRLRLWARAWIDVRTRFYASARNWADSRTRFRLSLGSVYRNAVMSDSPLGYWRLNDSGSTAIDIGSGGHNGTLSGTITTGVTGALTGDPDAAMTFDGSTGVIALGNSSDYQISTVSLEAWAKTSSADTGSHGVFIKSSAFGLFMDTLKFRVYDWNANTFRDSGVTINDGKWHHLVLTAQSGVTNGTNLYVDGTLRLTTTVTVASQSNGFQIGANTTVQFWPGQIDEVALYGSILSPTRILAHYNAALASADVRTRFGVAPGATLAYKDARSRFILGVSLPDPHWGSGTWGSFRWAGTTVALADAVTRFRVATRNWADTRTRALVVAQSFAFTRTRFQVTATIPSRPYQVLGQAVNRSSVI